MTGESGKEQAGPGSSKSKEVSLAGWSKDEKYELFMCIKSIGSQNIAAIQGRIPTKTTAQIKSALDYYKSIAFKTRDRTSKKGGRPKDDSNVTPSFPLSHWAKYLTDNIKFEDLQTEVATALRLIAECENIPLPVCTDYIDFRKAYHLLANAVEGKEIQDEPLINMLVSKSVVETALTSKAFLLPATVKRIVDQMDLNEENDVKNKYPVTDKEFGVVQDLAHQKNYNPMNISIEHLKAASD